MSEALKISLTAVGGVCIFVFGQIISKFFIEPIYEQRKAIGSIADGLIYYAGWIGSPGDADPNGERNKASDALRQLSCNLMAKTHAVPLYGLFAFLGFVRKREAVFESYKHLIFLSNSLFQGNSHDNRDAVRKIKEFLGMSF